MTHYPFPFCPLPGRKDDGEVLFYSITFELFTESETDPFPIRILQPEGWLVLIVRSCLSSLQLFKLPLRLCEFIGQLEALFEESEQVTLPVSVLSLSLLYPLK